MDFNPTYKLVLLVQNNQKYERLAKLLIGSLGLPQVGVYIYTGTLPSHCEAVILFGKKEWCDDVHSDINVKAPSIKVIAPTEGYLYHPENTTIIKDHEGLYEFPQIISHKYVPAKPRVDAGVHHIVRLSLYYTLKFVKKSALCQVSDCVYALILSYLASSYDLVYCRELLAAVLAKEEEVIDDYNNEQASLPILVQKILFSFNTDKIDEDSKILLFYTLKYIKEDFSLIGIEELLKSKPYHKEAYLEQRIQKATNTTRLAYYGIISFFQNNAELVDLVKKKILEELYDQEVCYIRSSTTGTGYCYSPLLSIFLLLVVNKDTILESFPVIKIETVPFEWHLLNASSLFDMRRLQYSQSLIENLEKALYLPSIPEGYQYEISSDSYSFVFLSLQKIWTQFITHCIHILGEDCILISPWPGDKEFALSLRYDVDRPLTEHMVFDILKLQKNYAEAAYATWFFFADDTSKEQKNLLAENFQEVGLHALGNNSHSLDVAGVTYHCGPNSSYWPGKDVFMIPNDNIRYTECLSIQTGKPLSCFLEDMTKPIWVTPLHFPMEKGTQLISDNECLEHLDQINMLLRLQGHIILGSHPDVNQRSMDVILGAINRGAGWLATIGEVVDRCMKILSYNNFYTQYQDNGELLLYSQHSIPKVQIKLIARTGVTRNSIVNVNAYEHKRVIFEKSYN